MAAPILGIDLGTTNSVVAISDSAGVPRVLADKLGSKVQPSVVGFLPNGQVFVGADAKRRKSIDPQNTIYSVKRLMGRASKSSEVMAIRRRVPYRISEGDNQQPLIRIRGNNYAPSDISARILDHMRQIAVRQLAVDSSAIERAVITVPANFNEAQRSATITAGAIAGLDVVRLINEPTAAALAYGQRKQTGGVVAVYDFGGGTFDVSILKLDGHVYQVIGTAGDSMLGGDDIDERLVQGMCAQFLQSHHIDLNTNPEAMMRLRQLAEDVKIDLSRTMRSKVRIEEVAYGQGGAPLGLEVEMTREQLVEKIRPLVDRTFPVCEEALTRASLSKSQITDIVLVGGTTRIPYIQKAVAQFFGSAPRTDINPDEAIAAGAAIQGEAQRVLIAAAAHRHEPASDTVTEVDPIDPISAKGPAIPPPLPLRAETDTAATEQNLARVNLKKVAKTPRTATPAIREVARDGAIKAPSVTPAPPMAARADDAPLEDLLDEAITLQRERLPLVRDVTPHSLGIATVGGYCDVLVRRNAQLPTRQERVFSSAQDGQRQVRIRVYQGESKRLIDNTLIGTLVLDGLPGLMRGDTQIEVAFDIDQNGLLHVSARDPNTGRERSARVDLLGAQSQEQVAEAKSALLGARR